MYNLDCVVHEFILGKLVFKAINALSIRRKIPHKAIFISFIHTCHKSKVMSKNVKQYLISCPTLVLRYISLNILSKKTFTVRNCFSFGWCQGGKIQGVKGSCLSMDNLKND